MDFLILLLLALDFSVFGFNYPDFQKQNVYKPFLEELDYNTMGSSSCSTTSKPLCGTNGKEFIYFENKCEFELKNHELLTQGKMEYNECPCPSWDLANEPVFAAEKLSGIFEDFSNPYDAQSMPFISQKDFLIDDFQEHYFAEEDDFLSLSKTQEEEEDSECPRFCTFKYQPICAIFMTLEKEFLNECELKTTICQTKQKWSILKEGPCQPANNDDDDDNDAAPAESSLVESRCPQICPFEYKPVCAKLVNEFREFSNECELESTICQLKQDWQIVNEGPCWDNDQSYLNAEVVLLPTILKCSQVCTSEYRPVCAKFNNDLREFSNKCMLERTMCETKEKWEIVNLGKCVSPSHRTTSIVKRCLKSCSNKYSPICAIFKNQIREFSNKCLLENWNCESDKKWEIKNLGPCSLDSKDMVTSDSKCPKFCTQIFNPICAKLDNDLREFPNGCELQKTNCESKKAWKVIKFGPCLSQSTICPQICPSKYQPVCAVFNLNLKEFQNECQLKKTICDTKDKWQILKKGRCPLISESKGFCPNFCTKAFSPICAKYKDELKEFFNICEFQKRRCETNIDWKIFNRGPCPVKALTGFAKSSCDNEPLDPICAVFSLKTKTFNNICQLAQEMEKTGIDWSILHKGNCNSSRLSTKKIKSKNSNSNNLLTKVSSTVSADKAIYTVIVAPPGSSTKLNSSAAATTIAIPKTMAGLKYSATSQTLMDILKKKVATDESNKDFRKISLTKKINESDSETFGKIMGELSSKNMKEKISYNDSISYKLSPSGISRKQNTDDKTQENQENTRFLETVKRKNGTKVNRINFTYLNKTYSSKLKSSNDEKIKIAKAEAAADNAESVVKVLEALLDKTDDGEEDSETLLSQESTSSEGEVTEKNMERNLQLNSTNIEQNYSKYNNSNSKKGEIYNGVVYKGAVYDAPTYNFIYTAPNHYLIPFNYPASAGTTNTSIDLLKLLHAMNRGIAKPNLSPVPEDSEINVSKGKGNLVDVGKKPMEMEKSLLKLPLNSLRTPTDKEILTQNQPSRPMFVPLSKEQLMPLLASINSKSAPQLHNSPMLQQNKDNENKQKHNFAAAQTDSMLQEKPDKFVTKASDKIFRVSSQPLTQSTAMSFGHHSMPAPLKPVPLNAANSAKHSLNSTVLNKIMKTIKSITNHF